MRLFHPLASTLVLPLERPLAIAFVRDVPRSLSAADFMKDLELLPGTPTVVSASIPVNAALFGQRDLPFRSRLVHTPDGARLEPLPRGPAEPAWAEVTGVASVAPDPAGSLVRYELEVAIQLELPRADRWGGRALKRMIEFTAEQVLESVTASFPAAIRSAAESYLAERIEA